MYQVSYNSDDEDEDDDNDDDGDGDDDDGDDDDGDLSRLAQSFAQVRAIFKVQTAKS